MILLLLPISRCQHLSRFRFISNLITRKKVTLPILFVFRKTIISLRKVRHSNHQPPVLLDARLTDALRGVIFCLLSFGKLTGSPGVRHYSFVIQPPDLPSWFYVYHGLQIVEHSHPPFGLISGFCS